MPEADPEPAFLRAASAPVAASPDNASAASTAASGPTWHAPSTPVATQVQPDASADTPDIGTPDVVPASVELDTGAAVELPPGVERIELARAYIELGDTETARSLLQETVDGDDPAAAAQAAQMLRTLG